MRCDGVCGRELSMGERVVEIERTHVFCMTCALVTTTDHVLMLRGQLFDSATCHP